MLLWKGNHREKGEVPAPTHQELPVREGKQTPGALLSLAHGMKLSFLYLQPRASSPDMEKYNPEPPHNLEPVSVASSELSSSCAIAIPALSSSLGTLGSIIFLLNTRGKQGCSSADRRLSVREAPG